MAKRLMNVCIKSSGKNTFRITIDDDKVEGVEALDGVASVGSKNCVGDRLLYVDKRFDADEVLADIRALADA